MVAVPVPGTRYFPVDSVDSRPPFPGAIKDYPRRSEPRSAVRGWERLGRNALPLSGSRRVCRADYPARRGEGLTGPVVFSGPFLQNGGEMANSVSAGLARVFSVALLAWAAAPGPVSGERPCDRFQIQPHLHNDIHRRLGVLLWSWGRSGTGTVWDSLRFTLAQSGMAFHALCGQKEGLPSSCLKGQHMDT